METILLIAVMRIFLLPFYPFSSFHPAQTRYLNRRLLEQLRQGLAGLPSLPNYARHLRGRWRP